MERRRVLALLVQAGSGLIALVVGLPALIYAFAPVVRRGRGAQWREIGPLEAFPMGQTQAAVIQPSQASPQDQVVPQGVYVRRVSEQEIVVFSRSCTDLGCPVTFDEGSHCFLCPCHGGIFDAQGERMAGPPDRPLDRYEYRIEEGQLQVNLSSVPPMS